VRKDAFALDVGISPAGALARLSSAINRPKRRSLGVFKLENEFLGRVNATEFEIWERGQHAIHARGHVRGRRAGTRIEMRFVLSTRARILLPVFAVLYALLSLGFALGDPAQAGVKIAVALAGALLIALIFLAGALRQRADLRRFVERLFADTPPT